MEKIKKRGLFGGRKDFCVGLDFGTAFVRACTEDADLLFEEPALLALRQADGSVAAMGAKAQKQLADPANRCRPCYPLWECSMSRDSAAMELLRGCIRQIADTAGKLPGRLIICLHCEPTEETAILETACAEGIPNVCLIRAPLAAAIGTGAIGGEVTTFGHMVVSIGAVSTDIGVFSMRGMLYDESIRVGGIAFDEAIGQEITRQYGVAVSRNAAEQIKKKLDGLYPAKSAQNVILSVTQKPVISGGIAVRKKVTVSPAELPGMLREPLLRILDAVSRNLERAPLELLGDLKQNGILLVGGSSALKGLETMISQATGLPVSVPPNALTCCAEGAARAFACFGEGNPNAINFSEL